MHAWRAGPPHAFHPAFRDDPRRRMPRQAQRPYRNDGGGGRWGRLAIITVRAFSPFRAAPLSPRQFFGLTTGVDFRGNYLQRAGDMAAQSANYHSLRQTFAERRKRFM